MPIGTGKRRHLLRMPGNGRVARRLLSALGLLGVAVGAIGGRLRGVESMATGEVSSSASSSYLPDWFISMLGPEVLTRASLAYGTALHQARQDYTNKTDPTRLTKNDNYEPFYPACLIFDNANKLGPSQACAFLRVFRAVTSTWPSIFSNPLTSELPVSGPKEEDEAAQELLPRPLDFDTRRGQAPPRLLEHSAVEGERATYYYLYRLIFRLYKHVYDYQHANSNQKPELPLLAPGWTQQKVYYLNFNTTRGWGPLSSSSISDRSNKEMVTPFAVSVVKGDRMMLVFRGTMFTEEWLLDWQYQYSQEPLSSELFPGKVHHGVFNVFKMVYKDILQEVLRVGPRHVLIGGHSLGGVMGILHGYHIQDVLQQIHQQAQAAAGAAMMPEDEEAPRVDVVAIGAPLVGDADFVAATGRMINQRSIVYVGAGGPGAELRVGDPIPQYTCGPFLGCDSLGTGPDGSHYAYARPPCLIAFTAQDLGDNTQRWHQAENLFMTSSSSALMPSSRNIVACHLCSYMCWLSKATGDKYSLCYFKDQEQAVGLPDNQLCYFPDIPF